MNQSVEKGNYNRIWERLAGSADEFSMENRAFNYVCIISFALLVVCLVLEIFIGVSIMVWVISVLMLLLGVMYYISRYHRNYRIGIILYVLGSYSGLIINYFVNDGINGPTLSLFLVVFIFLITLAKAGHHFIWAILHIAIITGLLVLEYFQPQLIPSEYPDRASRFIDTITVSGVCVMFVYAITRYLRTYYNTKRILADERAFAISEQNKQIMAQNQQLEIVNEEKNKLFSIVSHDLKAPLDSIRGYLVLLSDNLLDESEKEKIQEELLEQTKYTTDLLLNLMSWAKAQMHGVTVNLAPVNLKNLVEEVAGHKTSVAARKGIKLTYSIPGTIEVIADRDMLHIVLRNLINNAIKFTDGGGEVYIRVATDGKKAVLSVNDTGIGIPPEKQSEIFSLRTRSTYGTNKEKGIGLGLMMCKEFMDYQQGDIWFESAAGKGSVFYISLPLTML